jgi:hypothetical protein
MNIQRNTIFAGMCAVALSGGCDKSNSLGQEPTSGSVVDPTDDEAPQESTGEGDDGDDTGQPDVGQGEDDDILVTADIELVARIPGERFELIAERSDGGFVVAGAAEYRGTSGDEARFISMQVTAFAADGSKLWGRGVENTGWETGSLEYIALDVADDDAVFVTATDFDASANGFHLISKYEADGTLLWETTLDGHPDAVAALPGGGAVVAGHVSVEGEAEGWLATLDSEGEVLQTRQFPNNDEISATRFRAAVAPYDGGFLVGGSITQRVDARPSGWLLEVDPSLEVLSELWVHSPMPQSISSLRSSQDGTFVALSQWEILTVLFDTFVDAELAPLPHLQPLSAHTGQSYLGRRGQECGDDSGFPFPCESQVFEGVVDGLPRWQAEIEGCVTMAGYAVADDEAIVSMLCQTGPDDVPDNLATELYRITADL